MMLGGHVNTIGALAVNASDPQVISGSHDCTIKLWDLAKGAALTTMTHHKKAIRDLTVAPFEFSFVSGAADNIKKWQCKDGALLRNLVGHAIRQGPSSTDIRDTSSPSFVARGTDGEAPHLTASKKRASLTRSQSALPRLS